MARQARAEAVQTERRRRRDDTLDRIHGLKLALPVEFRNDPNYEYRWINDENSRVHDLTVEDDWEICRIKGVEAGDDDKVRRVMGTKKNGAQMDGYLVRKRKEWVEEDRRKKSAIVTADEQAALSASPSNSPDGAYVAPGSSIRRRGPYAP